VYPTIYPITLWFFWDVTLCS